MNTIRRDKVVYERIENPKSERSPTQEFTTTCYWEDISSIDDTGVVSGLSSNRERTFTDAIMDVHSNTDIKIGDKITSVQKRLPTGKYEEVFIEGETRVVKKVILTGFYKRREVYVG